MHTYITTRGVGRFTRRLIEDLEDVYFNFINKDTGKKKGMVSVGVREIRVWEVVHPKGSKKVLKEKLKELSTRHKWCAVKVWGSKRDKFVKGLEFL